nr:MAG TPA: hypothetical protein [Caudoviricetes sp.]
MKNRLKAISGLVSEHSLRLLRATRRRRSRLS